MKPTLAIFLTAAYASFVPTFSNEDVQQIICNSELDSTLLHDTKKVYYCVDNQHMVFHSSSLNTLGPDAKNPLATEIEIKDLNKMWVEVETNNFTINMDGGIPLTNCLSLEHGQTGVISGTFGDSFATSASLDLNYALINAGAFQLNWNIAGGVGASLSTSAEYSCNGKSGQTVQLTVVPAYYRFRDAEFRFLYLTKKKQKEIIKYERWQLSPDTQVLASAPMLKCVTDKLLLRCDSAIANPWLPF